LTRIVLSFYPVFFFKSLSEEVTMALFITEACTYCGACEPECPTQAISAGDDVYVINGSSCNECAGDAEGSHCVNVCPSDAIVQG